MKKFWFAGLAIFTFLACEKDDICDGGESVTPNVVVNLYDRLNADALKPAVKIAIAADGFNDTLFYTSTAKIELPLQITENQTTWNIKIYELNTTNDTITRNDKLQFNYTTEALYVSKACGYKTIFHNFNAVKLPNTTNNGWIQSLYKVTNEITNNTNAHIQLYY